MVLQGFCYIAIHTLAGGTSRCLPVVFFELTFHVTVLGSSTELQPTHPLQYVTAGSWNIPAQNACFWSGPVLIPGQNRVVH